MELNAEHLMLEGKLEQAVNSPDGDISYKVEAVKTLLGKLAASEAVIAKFSSMVTFDEGKKDNNNEELKQD